eukprot:COSAG02_NODE_1927_length_10340_cov_2.510497_8_plen_83_part_00
MGRGFKTDLPPVIKLYDRWHKLANFSMWTHLGGPAGVPDRTLLLDMVCLESMVYATWAIRLAPINRAIPKSICAEALIGVPR